MTDPGDGASTSTCTPPVILIQNQQAINDAPNETIQPVALVNAEGNNVRQELQEVQNDNQNPPVQNYVTTGLEAYLKKNSIGKEILKAYKECQKKNLPLKSTTRSKLVRLIIAREKDFVLRGITEDQSLEKFVITKQRFEILATEIEHLFKGEVAATYFTPFIQQGKQCILANGKLWHHYNYTKQCLRESQLLARKSLGNTSRNVLSPEELAPINNDINITWLHNHIQPWNEVVERWSATFQLRRQLLLQSNLPVHEYLNNFPCLQIQKGTELLSNDFGLMFPDKLFVSQENWKKIKSTLINCFQALGNIKAIEDSILLGLLKSRELSSEKEDFIILHLLCYLIAPKRNGKRKREANDGEPRRLSIQERRESFILRVETAEDVQPKLLQLKEQYIRDHKTFQPVILAVGAAIRIESYYVVINEKLFTVETPLAAVELALKIFFALDCQYPLNTRTVWVFLQRILFTIELPLDVVTVDCNIILGQINSSLS